MPVTSITATVDEDTFALWNAALANLGRDVSVAVDILPPAPPSLSIPAPLPLTGLELLLEVGIACARPTSLDDPSRLFALFRYATALSRFANVLSLNRDLARLDRHKKGVLSDEFGCGMACLIGRRYASVDYFLDIDDAVRQRWIRTPAPRSKRPDYLGVIRGSDSLVVLEAKGSQGSSTYCRRTQIPTGCRQVSAVRPNPPYDVALRFVVSTLLQRDDQSNASTVFIGDPEEVAPFDYAFEGDLLRIAQRNHFARIAALIGAEGMARALGDREAKGVNVQRSRPAARRTIDGESYTGNELRFASAGQEAALFLGVAEPVWDALAASAGGDSEIPFGGLKAERAGRLVRSGVESVSLAQDDGVAIMIETAPVSPNLIRD